MTDDERELSRLVRGRAKEIFEDLSRAHGTAIASVSAAAYLDGIRQYLTENVGPEAAYAALQRQADWAAESIIIANAIRGV